MELYQQCTLKKVKDTGTLEQVSFIPKKYAVQGKLLKLKTDDGWDNGWVVSGCGIILPENQLQIYEDSHRNTRKASDI